MEEIDYRRGRVRAVAGQVARAHAVASARTDQRADQAVAVGPVSSAEEEFTAFVAANHGRLSHIAGLLTGNSARAEDLLQTVLARTYLRWSKVRQNNPSGYVRAGLVNARTDWWRRLSWRERPAAVLPDLHAVPDHAGLVVGRDAIQRALAGLTSRERAVVVLRFYEDLSEVEIARVLRIAPGTVKSACSRALAKLRVSPELTEPAATQWRPRCTKERP